MLYKSSDPKDETAIMVESEPARYIPALSFKALTPFFDPFVRWCGRDSTIKPKLIGQAGIKENFKVLDLGCGTGTLAILIKKNQPLSEVTGIDIDPDILKIAKTKAAKAGVQINLDLGASFELPYSESFFDRVLSSFVLHHLTTENKIRTLKEVWRVLKPHGELHVADFGKPQNMLMQLPSAFMRRLEESEDNYNGLLPRIFKTAGFDQVEEMDKIMTIFGTVALCKGRKPAF